MLKYADPDSEYSFYTMLAGPEFEAKRLALVNDIDADIANTESFYTLYRLNRDIDKLKLLQSHFTKMGAKYMSQTAIHESQRITAFIE
jgi:hypothetical protein